MDRQEEPSPLITRGDEKKGDRISQNNIQFRASSRLSEMSNDSHDMKLMSLEVKKKEAEIDKLKIELAQQKEMLNKLNETTFNERERNDKLAKALREKEDNKNTEVVDSEYKKKFMEIHPKYQEQQKNSKDLEHRIQVLTRDLKELEYCKTKFHKFDY